MYQWSAKAANFILNSLLLGNNTIAKEKCKNVYNADPRKIYGVSTLY